MNAGCIVALFALASLATPLRAQEPSRFTGIQLLSTRETLLKLSAPNGLFYRIDAATQVPQWRALLTYASAGVLQHTDGAAAYLEARYYRAEQLSGTNLFTGDHVATDAGDVIIHPVYHASFVMRWGTNNIYCDPDGSATLYQALGRANLVLYTHDHGDHYDATTLAAVRLADAPILAPKVVYDKLAAAQKSQAILLTNGASVEVMGLKVEAISAYNLSTSHHPKGVGNGYVLTIGGKRIYISGDTEDIPEMRALTNIDVAFLAMNLPYTMSVARAVSATRAFRPKVVYPYHYQGNPVTDLGAYKQQVGTDVGVEVRLRNWY